MKKLCLRVLETRMPCSILLLAALGFNACRSAQPATNPPEPVAARAAPRVVAVGLTVSNLARASAAFERLGFIAESDAELAGNAFSALVALPDARARARTLRLGDERIELTEYATAGRATPSDSRSNDAWFEHLAIVVSDMDAAFARVASDFRSEPGSTPIFYPTSPAPQTIPLSNPAAGGIRASYFKDFDGHNLELIWYPRGKGRDKWHSSARAGLFLGLDHTAIAATDSDASLEFYRDALGLKLAGSSLNSGVEQAKLSGVPAARVRITGLSADAPPGVEFLQYLEPVDGRRTPKDSQANDLWHWQIHIVVGDLATTARALELHGGRRISTGIVIGADFAHPRRGELLIADRDGHVVRLIQE